jgi:hypothetical protein
MTLVVARASEQAIHFVSDTRRTPAPTRDKQPIDLLRDGLLKCIAISPTLCVAFAGDIRSAQEAITPLIGQDDRSREDLQRHLLSHQQRERRRDPPVDVEFLLADSIYSDGIDRIWRGGIEVGQPSGWIGSQEAFEQFQQHMLQASQRSFGSDDEQGADKMDRAIQEVIESGHTLDVGDVWVHTKGDIAKGFRYWARLESHANLPVENTTVPTSLLRSAGATGGSFRLSLLVPKEAGVAAIALYIAEIQTGALFYPRFRWDAHVVCHVSCTVFKHMIEEQSKLRFQGMLFG